MRTIDLAAWLTRVRARKAELGIVDTPERIESLRNKGGNRKPEKRELLRRADERARAAGKVPVKSYY